MTTQLQVRNDTTANWTSKNTILLAGEFGYDTILKQHKMGDGITPWNTLPWDTAGPKGDQGAAGNGGQVILDFGSEPGQHETYINITDTNILSTSIPVACLAAIATSDHTIDDHKFAAFFIHLSCGAPVAGVGFTIYAICEEELSGTFAVNYTWV